MLTFAILFLLFAMIRIVTISHAPENFHRITQQIRYGGRSNCPIAVTAITSVQLHHSREDFHASEREPDANLARHPEARHGPFARKMPLLQRKWTGETKGGPGDGKRVGAA